MWLSNYILFSKQVTVLYQIYILPVMVNALIRIFKLIQFYTSFPLTQDTQKNVI